MFTLELGDRPMQRRDGVRKDALRRYEDHTPMRQPMGSAEMIRRYGRPIPGWPWPLAMGHFGRR